MDVDILLARSVSVRRPTHATRVAITCLAALGAFITAKSFNLRSALLLHNGSPSEPEGLYVRAPEPPAVGRLVAFMAPSAAAEYVDQHLRILERTPVLKTLVAGPGESVCTTSRQLVIDGKILAPIATTDPHGGRLPHWNGCRRLRAGEWFAYSDRVPNSFDSRYYGPITKDQVIAVYRPLWVGSQRSR
jgi:conjugative transfer signal peptidase TraF